MVNLLSISICHKHVPYLPLALIDASLLSWLALDSSEIASSANTNMGAKTEIVKKEATSEIKTRSATALLAIRFSLGDACMLATSIDSNE